MITRTRIQHSLQGAGQGLRLVDVARFMSAENWEHIAMNLRRAGYSFGMVGYTTGEGRAMWMIDAQRHDGPRYIVHAENLVTAFVELQVSVKSTRQPCRN